MGAEVALIFSGISAIGSIMGGMQAQKESVRQSAIAQAQGNLQAEETARATAREANFVSMEAESIRRKQKLAYLKSGVDLEGSPLLMMEATRKNGLDNVEEVFRSGGMNAGGQVVEGRNRAAQLQAQGRQQFMQGISNAVSTAAGAGMRYK